MGDEGLGSALQELVRQGNLYQHQSEHLLDACLKGEHTIIVGPHRGGKIKLAQALAQDIGQIARVWEIKDVADRSSLVAGLKHASLAGAEYVLLMDILPAELFWILTGSFPVCVIATLPLANSKSLQSSAGVEQFGFWRKFLRQSVYQVGFDFLGNARLVDDAANVALKALPSADVTISQKTLFPKNWEQDTAIHDPGWELDSADPVGSTPKTLSRREEI